MAFPPGTAPQPSGEVGPSPDWRAEYLRSLRGEWITPRTGVITSTLGPPGRPNTPQVDMGVFPCPRGGPALYWGPEATSAVPEYRPAWDPKYRRFAENPQGVSAPGTVYTLGWFIVTVGDGYPRSPYYTSYAAANPVLPAGGGRAYTSYAANYPWLFNQNVVLDPAPWGIGQNVLVPHFGVRFKCLGRTTNARSTAPSDTPPWAVNSQAVQPGAVSRIDFPTLNMQYTLPIIGGSGATLNVPFLGNVVPPRKAQLDTTQSVLTSDTATQTTIIIAYEPQGGTPHMWGANFQHFDNLDVVLWFPLGSIAGNNSSFIWPTNAGYQPGGGGGGPVAPSLLWWVSSGNISSTASASSNDVLNWETSLLGWESIMDRSPEPDLAERPGIIDLRRLVDTTMGCAPGLGLSNLGDDKLNGIPGLGALIANPQLRLDPDATLDVGNGGLPTNGPNR